MAKYKSRATRFDELKQQLESIASEAESLKEELEQWKENMPENLQDGDKAQEIEGAVDGLDDFIQLVNEAMEIEIEFPGR